LAIESELLRCAAKSLGGESYGEEK